MTDANSDSVDPVDKIVESKKKAAKAAKPAKPSTLNIYQKIAKITGEIGTVAKGGQNKEQGYAFIEYAAVAGKLRSLFDKYGVVIVPNMGEQKRESFTTKGGKVGTNVLIDFTFDVVNADNPEDRFKVNWVGEATDYGDKGTNKAATAAVKYYQMRQFNISEQGEDADAQTIERATPTPPRYPSQVHNNTTLAPQGNTRRPSEMTPLQKAKVELGRRMQALQMTKEGMANCIVGALDGKNRVDTMADVQKVSAAVDRIEGKYDDNPSENNIDQPALDLSTN